MKNIIFMMIFTFEKQFSINDYTMLKKRNISPIIVYAINDTIHPTARSIHNNKLCTEYNLSDCLLSVFNLQGNNSAFFIYITFILWRYISKNQKSGKIKRAN